MKRLNAFTLAEIVATMLVITVVLVATLTTTKSKMEKVDKYYYYMAYSIAKDISQNVISQNNFGFAEEEASSGLAKFANKINNLFVAKLKLKGVYAATVGTPCTMADGTSGVTNANGACVFPEGTPCTTAAGDAGQYNSLGLCVAVKVVDPFEPEEDVELKSSSAADLCDAIIKVYNVNQSNCAIPASTYLTATTSGDFLTMTPHVVLNNGLRLFIASDFINIERLATEDASVNEKDKTGFILYVDSNGETAGKNKVNADVFPFYLLKSGKMVPDGGLNHYGKLGGADSTEHLTVNILYDDFSNDTRTVKILARNVDYKTGACKSGNVVSTTYCTLHDGTVVQKDAICDDVSDCRIQVNRPMRKLF